MKKLQKLLKQPNFLKHPALKHTRFTKANLAIFIIIFACIGGYVILHSFAAGTTANLWVDTNGGTCARSATPGAYVDAGACASMQAAVAACQAGDIIRMKAGTYGAQTITSSSSSPGCNIIAESGVSGGNLATNGSWLTINGGTWQGWEPTGTGLHDIHLVNATVTSQVWISNCCSNISMVGGSVSGVIDGGAPTAVMIQSLSPSTPVSAVTFDGVEFKNANCTTAGNHFEVLRTQGWVSNLVIKNSYFHDNGVNSSQIFISSFTGGTDQTPGPIVIEGNYFAPPVTPTCGSAAFFQINGNLQGDTCPDLSVRYNTSQSSLTTVWDSNGANCSTPQSNIKFKSNISTKAAGNCGSNSWDHNIWINGSSANCGAGDQTVASAAAAGLTGDGFHITSSSVALNAGDVSFCPSIDRDGDTRPQGAACDAGADEFASGGTSVLGDLNSDSHVTVIDLSILLSHYGQSGQTLSTGDCNNDGAVTVTDLSILLSHYGS
jgi:hypothetical protein